MEPEKKETMHYLWKDSKGIFYITDYKEVRESDGFVNVEPYGFKKLELVFSDPSKAEVLNFAQKQ